MNPQAHIIFTDLEAPIPIMFWEPLEFVMALTLFGFGIISDLWMFGASAGTAVLIGAKYMKRGAKKGMVQHWFWSLGLNIDPPLKKYFKPAWDNEFSE